MMFLLFLLVIGRFIMVRHYKKKGVYSQYDITKVEEAVANYRSGKLSLRKCAKKYGIPRSTISDHALGKVLPGSTIGCLSAFCRGCFHVAYFSIFIGF